MLDEWKTSDLHIPSLANGSIVNHSEIKDIEIIEMLLWNNERGNNSPLDEQDRH